MRSLIVLSVAALALVVAGGPAAAADRQCGVVTGIFLGDLPSGGTVSIDGRKFLVGGVGPRNVDLSAAGQLSVGSRACAEGEFRVMTDGSVNLYNGRVFPNIAGLPSTTTVSAATVGCGKVTTFVAPDSAGALPNGDGWMIFVKADGSSDKVIIRSGRLTSTGSIGGYICLSIDGVYFNGLLAPGTSGYIVEPLGFGSLPSTSTSWESSEVVMVRGLPATSTVGASSPATPGL